MTIPKVPGDDDEKLKAIAHVTGVIAHDINNLLCIIVSYTTALLQELPADNSLTGDIREIHSAGQRISTFTQELAALGGHQILRPERVNLKAFIQGYAPVWRTRLGTTISFSARIAPELHTAWVDAEHLANILLALVDNAREALPESGRVHIEAQNVTVDTASNAAYQHLVHGGRYVELRLCDDGAGIDSDAIAHLFEPFYTRKPKPHRGLSLALAFSFLKQSGGSISVESDPGHGTIVTILLPHAPRAEMRV